MSDKVLTFNNLLFFRDGCQRRIKTPVCSRGKMITKIWKALECTEAMNEILKTGYYER